MLVEIRCKIFRQKTVSFLPGLNVVLGDDASTNSIGKSTMLMIVDFVFGGSDYISKNSGSIDKIGHHTIQFEFNFGNDLAEKHFFERSTESPNSVNVCSNTYERHELITLKEFQTILLNQYELDEISSTFRKVVSPFSRVWGRKNIDVDKPLITAQKASEEDSIEILVRLFERYPELEDFLINIKAEKEVQSTIRKLFKNKLALRITKSKWRSNIAEIENLENRLDEIKRELVKYTLNIEAIKTGKVVSWKTEKSQLLGERDRIINKIQRLELNLDGKRVVNSKKLKKLQEFFENVNLARLSKVEEFHQGISKILKEEIERELLFLKERRADLDQRIKAIDKEIDKLIGDTDSTRVIVERIYDLSYTLNKLKDENKFYEKRNKSIAREKELNNEFQAQESTVFKEIEERINSSLGALNVEIYGGDRVAPKIKVWRNKYEFDHSQNTGTGKGFIDLVSFDLAIFERSRLPYLIHDSPVFKNVEDRAFEKIIEKYLSFDRQIFISIDGISRYYDTTQRELKERARLELSDENMLFEVDWR